MKDYFMTTILIAGQHNIAMHSATVTQ